VRRAAVALVTLAVAILALAGRADAFIYWTNSTGGATPPLGTIGRANLDGTGVNQNFIGADNPQGIAVDGAHIYWADLSSASIGRANLDGTGVNQSFIGPGQVGVVPGTFTPPGAFNPQGMAVDGAYVYWADSFLDQNNLQTGVIARANLDGTGINDTFIVVEDASPLGVAIDGTHVYWTGSNVIGRANLDGTGVTQGFIAGANEPWGVAVDGAHIYWVNTGNDTIGIANLDGTGVNQSFIATGLEPEGIAVDGAHIYWVNTGNDTIGIANLDGTGVNQSFITGASTPVGVAVDGLVGPPLPSTTTTMTTSTTTSTTLASGCGVRAVTFASIMCRLDALLGTVQATTDLGATKTALANGVTAARSKTESAEDADTAGQKKPASNALKKAARKMIGFSHRLRSLRSRKKIPAATRSALLAEADPILADLEALRNQL